jgi:hypothetical protein
MRSAALVLAGVFLGGALDHVILAIARSPRTPYGIRSGPYGNWMLALFDLVIASVILRGALTTK